MTGLFGYSYSYSYSTEDEKAAINQTTAKTREQLLKEFSEGYKVRSGIIMNRPKHK